jgi:hypothetical protein
MLETRHRKGNKSRTANSRFAKAGVSSFYDSEVLNSRFVHLMKFSAKNPRLRKAAKRYVPFEQAVSSAIKTIS